MFNLLHGIGCRTDLIAHNMYTTVLHEEKALLIGLFWTTVEQETRWQIYMEQEKERKKRITTGERHTSAYTQKYKFTAWGVTERCDRVSWWEVLFSQNALVQASQGPNQGGRFRSGCHQHRKRKQQKCQHIDTSITFTHKTIEWSLKTRTVYNCLI